MTDCLPLTRLGHLCAMAICALSLGACSPALDWRDARLSSRVKLLLPCKPDRVERELDLQAGGHVRALMLVCDAQGITWAATRYELPAASDMGAVLRELRYKLAQNIGGEEHATTGALPLGATALAEAGHSEMAGRRPNGDKVKARAMVFAQTSDAYQLVALLPADAPARLAGQTAQFFEGVQIGH